MGLRTIFFDLWTLAKPALVLTGLFLAIRVIVFRNTDTNWGLLAGALLLMLVGLYLFLSGISSSLIPLSEATGRDLVLVRYKIPVILFVGLIGYFATLLEPGLRILANQIETVSVGAIHSSKITHMAAVGFAIGAGLGTGRILSPFSMKLSAGIALMLLFLLVLLAPESIVGIAFDCASATTGPVNIPILLGLAIGLSQVVSGVDPLRQGFGLIALTAYGTTTAVLIYGILRIRS